MPAGVFVRTVEYREKMRQIALRNGNKPPSPKGKIMSQETKDKLRKQRIGIARPKEVVEKISGTFFKKGHTPFNKGKVHLPEDKNPAWKGDSVGYYSLHNWVKRKLGKANRCVHSGYSVPCSEKFEWASKSHNAKRDINDYMSLCIRHHRRYDKWAQNMWKTRKGA